MADTDEIDSIIEEQRIPALEVLRRIGSEKPSQKPRTDGECALIIHRATRHRLKRLGSFCATAIAEADLDLAVLCARSYLTSLGFDLLLYKMLTEGVDQDEIIRQFLNSNDYKRKIFRNTSIKKKHYFTSEALEQFGKDRSPRVSSGQAIKDGLGYFADGMSPGAKQSVVELYDTLSELCHESQMSLLGFHTELYEHIPTSVGRISTSKGAELACWQALRQGVHILIHNEDMERLYHSVESPIRFGYS